MEYEKIKIYVTNRVYEILLKDAEIFGFLKSDGVTPNKNAFLSMLILNYLDTYQQKQNYLNSTIRDIIKQNSYLNDDKITNLSGLITSKINDELASDLVEKFDKLISLKPTKATINIIEYISGNLLNASSLSGYFRNMFTAYTQLPQDIREQIVFKQSYQQISEAINRRQQIFVSVAGKQRSTLRISPYCFSRSKEEIHIYLIYKHEGTCKSIKLSKIEAVTILNSPAEFNENDLKVIKKMQKYGAQFSYNYNEEPAVVRLNTRGQSLFHKIYVHRPIPDEINGDLYTFNCSNMQVLQYFSRFGSDVEIISPAYLKSALFDFHNGYVKKNQKNS